MLVLFADDDITMRMSVARYLEQWGYEAVIKTEGKEAYEFLMGRKAPCLAILDWMMPGMDGVDICRQLRQRPKGAPFIYHILLTAKTGKSHLIEGLEAGAHDFLRKPFDPDELRVRLDVGSRILAYEQMLSEKNDALACYARDMESLAEDRARQLLQADRMSTLGLMLAGVAHEIGNVLMAITANISEMLMLWPEIETVIKQYLEDADTKTDSSQLSILLDEMPDILNGIDSGAQRAATILTSLQHYSRQSETAMKPMALRQIVAEALDLCRNRLKTTVHVVENHDDSLPATLVNEQRLLQVLVNLFINASDAMEGRRDAQLRIATLRDGHAAIIQVEDNGPGLPQDKLDTIWQPFFTTKAEGKGTGLGLSICRTIVEEHQGEITAENLPGGGARFVIRLPFSPDEFKQ